MNCESKDMLAPAMTVSRRRTGQGDVISLDRQGVRENFLFARPRDADDLSIFDNFSAESGDVVAQMVFGGCRFHDPAQARMGGAGWPMMWLQGDVSPGTRINGMQAFALEGQPVGRVELGGRTVGSTWSDDDADYCLLAGVLPSDLAVSGGAQTQNCFEQIEAALAKAGMDFSHVVRTWLYLDGLLSWYDEFNVARTAFFEKRGVFNRLVPASTGIGAINPFGAALTAGALAIRPRHGGVDIREVGSPLQCPATAYRSSFSRAVEVAYPDRRLLLVSGTASIAPDGASEHRDDVVKQIRLTLDVVEAILRSRDMDWGQTVRAIGYFRDLDAVPIFEDCCRQRGLPELPLTPAHAAVCRDDLLFEIELDAISPYP